MGLSEYSSSGLDTLEEIDDQPPILYSFSGASTNLREIPYSPITSLQSRPSKISLTNVRIINQSEARIAHMGTKRTLTVSLRTAFDPAVPIPLIQNVVSTVNLGLNLDLKKIALSARNAEYNPKRFSAVVMRIREPRTTALIFNNGKIVCTGAKSIEMSRLAVRKFARIIQKLGFQSIQIRDFRIQNMVGSCDLKFHIQLEGLWITHAHFSTYEPELFPGLIYRMVKPKTTSLIFKSGKIIITGAQTPGEIYSSFNQIYPILCGFKR